MELISVIVPVYNVEAYLDRCITSLQRQTYRNLEIILVNDGSPDRCPAMCDSYASEDSRIKVVHKKNGGLSDARNAGLAIAQGKLIAFVDSDDWVADTYLEKMYQTMINRQADIVECSYIRTDGRPSVPKTDKNEECQIYDAKNALQQLILDHVVHQTVWDKLYRREIIEGIPFEKGKYNEDEFWTYQILGRCLKLVRIPDVLYYYFYNPASLIGQGFKFRRLDAIEAKSQRQQYIDTRYPELSELAATNLMASIIYAGQMSLLYLNEQEKQMAIKLLSTYVEECFSEKPYRFVGKIKHTIWYHAATHHLLQVCKIRNNMRMNID